MTTISTPDSRPVDTIVFILYTAKGQLQKHLQKVYDKTTKVLGMGRTKYVERAGGSMTDSSGKNVHQGCGLLTCYPCKLSKGQGISCRMESKWEKMKLWIIYEHMHLFKAKIAWQRGICGRINPTFSCNIPRISMKIWRAHADLRLGSKDCFFSQICSQRQDWVSIQQASGTWNQDTWQWRKTEAEHTVVQHQDSNETDKNHED